jgi:photosystem II stability/assembly factor-like uncharacterized protein
MKKIFYILSTLNLILTTCFAQSGWVKQSPLPTGNALVSSSFVNAHTGFAVGTNGTVIKTTNRGDLWLTKSSGTNSHFFSVCFVNQNIGYISGYNTFLKTNDGGENWIQIPVVVNGNGTLHSVYFVNENVGYIAGNDSLILKTTNGGINWQNISIGNENYFAVYFLNEQTGYVGGSNSQIYKTTNGGSNWVQQQTAYLIAITSLYFVNSDTGFMAGGLPSSGIIQKTTNGGANWYVVSTDAGYLWSIRFADAQTGYAEGWGGTLKSTDAGENWTLIQPYGYENVNPVDVQNVYLFGAGGAIAKTTNGGLNFFQQSSGSTGPIKTIFMINENTGYAGDIVIKTTNGGINWLYKGSATVEYLFFLNTDTGFAVGGINFLKTIDGANSWTETTISGNNLYSVLFINYDTGFVIGQDGVFKTTNSGLNWEEKYFQGGRSIFFVNSETGYATGLEYTSIIMKTTNAGENWNLQSIPTSEELKSIYFLNANTGYAAGGYHGIILKTTNGGNNWFAVYTSAGYITLNSVYFTNVNTGYAVAEYPGRLMKTTDGGNNWYTQNTGVTSGLLCIQFLNDSVGYIGGNAGIILKTTTGGEPIGIKQISSEIPNGFVLHQNYPNPFNPTTKIKFKAPLAPPEGGMQIVSLKIYDVLGKEVTTLFSSPWGRIGGAAYEVEWDGSYYPSGIYFYELETSEFSQAKKMILIK